MFFIDPFIKNIRLSVKFIVNDPAASCRDIHSPSPGYSADCCREEWRSDRAVALESEAV